MKYFSFLFVLTVRERCENVLICLPREFQASYIIKGAQNMCCINCKLGSSNLFVVSIIWSRQMSSEQNSDQYMDLLTFGRKVVNVLLILLQVKWLYAWKEVVFRVTNPIQIQFHRKNLILHTNYLFMLYLHYVDQQKN